MYGAELDAVARPWVGAFVNVRFGWLESQFLDFVQLQQEVIISPAGESQVTVNRELQNTGNRPAQLSPLQGQPHRRADASARALGLGSPRATTGSGPTRPSSTRRRGAGFRTRTTSTSCRGHHRTARLLAAQYESLAYRPAGGRFELAGWVRNLTNEAYKTFAFDGSTFNQDDHLLRGRSANLRRHPDRQLLEAATTEQKGRLRVESRRRAIPCALLLRDRRPKPALRNPIRIALPAARCLRRSNLADCRGCRPKAASRNPIRDCAPGRTRSCSPARAAG